VGRRDQGKWPARGTETRVPDAPLAILLTFLPLAQIDPNCSPGLFRPLFSDQATSASEVPCRLEEAQSRMTTSNIRLDSCCLEEVVGNFTFNRPNQTDPAFHRASSMTARHKTEFTDRHCLCLKIPMSHVHFPVVNLVKGQKQF
jgi:hypothetical protein